MARLGDAGWTSLGPLRPPGERERERDEDETEAERMPNRLSDEVQSSCENEHVCCPLSRCYPISFGMLDKVCGAREVSSLLPDNYECV